jgi:hypothetical protein
MKILLGNFIAKLGIESPYSPIVWKDSLHENRDNGVGEVNFANHKILLSRTKVFASKH